MGVYNDLIEENIKKIMTAKPELKEYSKKARTGAKKSTPTLGYKEKDFDKSQRV
jgi:hypothetical protein